jgi:hypothetical protein
MRSPGMMTKTLQIAAVLLVAVCLVPVGAHLLEMPGKMAMGMDAYFTVQPIYNGWALFGVAEAAAIVATLALAWMMRDQRMAMSFAAASAGLIVASLVAFFALTFPGNVATSNWTVAPDNWEALRLNWEIGHASAAILTLLSLAAATTSVVVAD